MAIEQSVRLAFLDGADQAPAHRDEVGRWGEKSYWVVNDSGIEDYEKRARLMGSEPLRQIITSTVGYDESNVGLDVAAGNDARALKDLLDMGVLRWAIATNYTDQRSTATINDPRLKHVKGDLTTPDPWGLMMHWQRSLAPQGLALVMHRPVGGLQELPFHTYEGAAHTLLDNLRPGGLMFTQIPRWIVAEKNARKVLCEGIWRRGDVADIVTSVPPDPAEINADWSDTFAAITMKPYKKKSQSPPKQGSR